MPTLKVYCSPTEWYLKYLAAKQACEAGYGYSKNLIPFMSYAQWIEDVEFIP